VSEGTEKRTKRLNGEATKWIGAILGVVGLVAMILGAWISMSNKHAEAVVRITHVESTVQQQAEDFKPVPADLAGIKAEQTAQRFLIERIDRRLESLTKPK
jgi:hypothetical protein